MNIRTLSLLVLILGLVACEPSPTPVEFTATPTLPSVLTREAVETTVAGPNYLVGCTSLSNTLLTEQISYKGVIPGQSTHDDVARLLGEPDEKATVLDQWLYDEGVNIIFAEGERPVVNLIEVSDGAALAKMTAPLLDMIEKYGCPEVIYSYATAIDNLSGQYAVTAFAYPSLGIQFNIPQFPASPSAQPDQIIIFPQESLSDYLGEYDWILDPNTASVLSWDEAVVK